MPHMGGQSGVAQREGHEKMEKAQQNWLLSTLDTACQMLACRSGYTSVRAWCELA